MKKNNINILSTRPLNNELIEQAEAQNIFIDQVSFIETTMVEDDNTHAAIRKYLSKNIVAIFTSMNAVEAVAKHIEYSPNWKIYCIGNTTKNLVAEYFGSEKFAGTALNATDLARVIIHDKISEVVFFCGDQRREELPGILKEHHVKLEEVIVYHTFETPVVISKKYDGILFFSPSAVVSFFSKNSIGQETKLFAIGATTAKAIQQYNKNNVVISGSPGKENLMKEVMEYYTSI